jgi:outer membrane lipoprotein-sorting protein
MRYGLLLLTAALLMLLPRVPAQAQDQECESLVARVQAQCDRFMAEVFDMTVVQTQTSVDAETQQRVFRKGTKSRVETIVAARSQDLGTVSRGPEPSNTVLIYDGTDGWIIEGGNDKTKIPSAELTAYTTTNSCWGFHPASAEVDQAHKIPDKNCCVVGLQDGDTRYELYLCTERLIILEGSTVNAAGRNLHWVHSDFRKVGRDFYFPFKTEVYVDRELQSTTVVRSIEVNTGLTDEVFDADHELKSKNTVPEQPHQGSLERP